MKSARDVAHALANSYDASCLDHEVLGWSHGPRCNDITEVIEARDRELREAGRVATMRQVMNRIAYRADKWGSDGATDKRVAAEAILEDMRPLNGPPGAAPGAGEVDRG